MRVDINSDMGEGIGLHRFGNDAELMKLIDVANVACGYHAGDPDEMDRTVALAAEQGVAALKIADPWSKLAAAYHVIGDRAALDDEGGVLDDPEQVVRLGVVGDELADVRDQGGGHGTSFKIAAIGPGSSACTRSTAPRRASSGSAERRSASPTGANSGTPEGTRKALKPNTPP